MRVKIKVTLTTGEEAIFHVAPQIYEIFKWHWEHKRDFKIANCVMKSDEILSIELMEIEVVE
nr:hypothetical protein [Streptococcus lutetiensis]